MFSLNAILDKIPRPDRSGVEGALFAIMVLGEILAPIYLGENAFCGILPWQCSVQASEPHEYRSTPIVFYGNGPGGRAHKCHCDERWSSSKWGTVIDHHISYDDCSFDAGSLRFRPLEPDGWVTTYGEGSNFNISVRQHCEKVSGNIEHPNWDPIIREKP